MTNFSNVRRPKSQQSKYVFQGSAIFSQSIQHRSKILGDSWAAIWLKKLYLRWAVKQQSTAEQQSSTVVAAGKSVKTNGIGKAGFTTPLFLFSFTLRNVVDSPKKIMGTHFLPAFPFVLDGRLGEKQIHDGINQLQFFAALAPEVPTWFRYKELNEPTPPKAWDELKPENFGKQEIWELKKWHQGEIFDAVVRADLQWYVREWNEYREALKEYRESEFRNRFFAWRWYYAQMMCDTTPVVPVQTQDGLTELALLTKKQNTDGNKEKNR